MITRKMRWGMTLAECVVVLVIIVTLAGLMIPGLTRAKRASLETQSIIQMRQIHAALTIYRQAWESAEGTLFHAMGLPTSVWRMEDGRDFPLEIRRSPFPNDPTISLTGVVNVEGEITFATNFYQPKLLVPGSANLIELGGYLEEFGEQALALFDPYCNDPGTNMAQPMIRKRVLGITIGGQLLRHYTYNPLHLNFRSYHPTQE